MSLDFLTPRGALLVLAVLVPLAAFLAVSARAAAVRAAIGLPELSASRRFVPVGAVCAIAVLLGLAAAQPILQSTTKRRMRSDAETYVAFDISRSMAAHASPKAPTRLQRAEQAGLRLRDALPGVPVGIASVTNRALPYLFPSPNEATFRSTLEQAIGIERPPPGTSFFTALQQELRNATNLGALSAFATQRFFAPTAKHRLLVVLTDGESPSLSPGAVGHRLRSAGISAVFIQFWGAKEKVYSNGVPELRYRPNPQARSALEALAAAAGGSVYGEGDVGAAIHKAKQDLGSGPTVVEADERGRPRALAPYLAGVAFFPLAFLLWRRDR
jgi:hypothetical protein